MTRKTFYNNKILKQYVESFSSIEGEPGKLVKASEIEKMKEKIERQADDISKMIARDIDIESLRHELNELKNIIEIKDRQIKNLTEMYESTVATITDIIPDKKGQVSSVCINTGKSQIYIYPEDFKLFAYHYDSEKKQLFRINVGGYKQFPMKLAYAVTMHKGQGQTVEAANINPYCTNPGQCYVALSRVRDIKQMHLLQPLDASMIYVDPVVQEFYANLKDNPPVPAVPVTQTAKKPGKKSNRPTGDKIMRIPNELVPLMQTAIDKLYNNPISGSVDLTEIQKFVDEAGRLL